MIFDDNVLHTICRYIDEPQTYFNFCLTSKKTAKVAQLARADKLFQFSRKTIIAPYIDGDDIHCSTPGAICFRLPNNECHGIRLELGPDCKLDIYDKEHIIVYGINYGGTLYKNYCMDCFKNSYEHSFILEACNKQLPKKFLPIRFYKIVYKDSFPCVECNIEHNYEIAIELQRDDLLIDF